MSGSHSRPLLELYTRVTRRQGLLLFRSQQENTHSEVIAYLCTALALCSAHIARQLPLEYDLQIFSTSLSRGGQGYPLLRASNEGLLILQLPQRK